MNKKNNAQKPLDIVVERRANEPPDSPTALLYIMHRIKNGEIIPAPFQREFVWSKVQTVEWIKTVIDQMAIGVIVTYQIKTGGATFLADGLQRLTASQLFLDDPSEYGFDFGPRQAEVYCHDFHVTLQHRVYSSHREALQAFQRLNSGTSLTRRWYYRGELTVNDEGDPNMIGKTIEDKIPTIVKNFERPYISKKNDKKLEDTFVRDSYALFLQYISGMTEMNFWDSSSTKPVSSSIQNRNIVEKELMKFIKGSKKGLVDVKNDITNFEEFIAGSVAEVTTLLDEAGGKGRSINQTLMRWLLHLAIWRKNNGRPIPLYQEFVGRMFHYLVPNYQYISSRFELPGDLPRKVVTLTSNNLKHLSTCCRAFNSELYIGQKRSGKLKVASGYHASHVEPFSKYGDGKTIPEPAPRNLARGAESMDRLL